MIISRSPLRLTFGGGGTDLPSYSTKHGGFCIGGAINKYVYVTLHENFTDDLIVKYSKTEKVATAKEIQNPLIRACFELLKMDGKGLEICTFADIPAGTGLGSSSAFVCALLRVLHAYRHDLISATKLAEEACQVELELLGEPIGKQDQYLSAIGGITALRFSSKGIDSAWRIPLSARTRAALSENLLLFFTGYSRSASAILKSQDDASKRDDLAMTDNLHATKESGVAANNALATGDVDGFCFQLNEQWRMKEQRSPCSPDISEWRDVGMQAGASACKLIGAGGGGFLMFYTHDRNRLREAMGLREVAFQFDYEGARIL